MHITLRALRAFRLDRVWWLVSPGNPLKTRGPAPLAERMAAARALIHHPRVQVTDIETRLRTRYTADTLGILLERNPDVRFVWLMGADNLATMHRWERWHWIMENVPVGVLARPGQQLRAGLSPAARRYARWRRSEEQAGALGSRGEPDWVLLTGAMSPLSSTALRGQGAWPG